MTLLSVTRVVQALDVHPNTVYRWIRSGQLCAGNIGTDVRPDYRIAPDMLADFLRRRDFPDDLIRRVAPTPPRISSHF